MSGKVYTFYSYKGGVGRTMAMANVGALLSIWGKKVLMIDWDLEAPGLENYFKSGNERLIEQLKNKEGLIDLILRRKQKKAYSADAIQWKDHISQIFLPLSTEEIKGKLDILHAGKKDEGYITRVRELDYGSFYDDQEGGEYFESMREYWISQYDIVLIDSRTGLTDSGGVCSIQMPDALVMLFTATDQGYYGTLQIADRAIEAQKNIIYDRYALKILPVPTRFDSTEFKLQREWLEKFETGLTKIYRTWVPEYPKEDTINIDLRKILELTKLPYIPYFSYGEKLPVIEEGTSNPQGLGYAFETMAAILLHDLEGAKLLSESRTEYVRRAIKGEEPYKEERELQQTVNPSAKSNKYIKYGLVGAVILLLMILLAQSWFFQKNKSGISFSAPLENNVETEQKLKYSVLETEYVRLDSNSIINVLSLNETLIRSGLFNDTSMLVTAMKNTINNIVQKEMEFTLPLIYPEIQAYHNNTRKRNIETPRSPISKYFSDTILQFGPYLNISNRELNSKLIETKLTGWSNKIEDKSINKFTADTNGFRLNYNELANYFFERDSSYILSTHPLLVPVTIRINLDLKIDSLGYGKPLRIITKETKLVKNTSGRKMPMIEIPSKMESPATQNQKAVDPTVVEKPKFQTNIRTDTAVAEKKYEVLKNEQILEPTLSQLRIEIVPDAGEKISYYQAEILMSDLSQNNSYLVKISSYAKYINEKTLNKFKGNVLLFTSRDIKSAQDLINYLNRSKGQKWELVNNNDLPGGIIILYVKVMDRKYKK